MAGEQMARLLSALFIGVLIARHLGPGDYGALNFAISFCSIFGIFANLGLRRAVVRDLSEADHDPVQMARIVTSVTVLQLMAALLCAGLATGTSLVFDQGQPAIIAVVSFTMVFAAFDNCDLFFQSQMRSRITVLARSIAFFTFIAVKIGLLFMGAGLMAFAVATTAEAAFGALMLLIAYRRFGPRAGGKRAVDLGHALAMVRQSWPEIFAGFANMIFIRIDQIMLGNMVGAEAVGIYSVASRLAEAWYFVPSALVASSFPAIVRLRSSDRAAYLAALQRLMAGLVAMSYAVAIIVTLVGAWAVEWLYGPAYAGSGQVLMILTWSGLFVTMGIASGSYIMAERKPMLNLSRNICGAVTNIALNLVLIPRYGPQGAAIGTLASQAIAFFLSDILTAEMRPIGRMKLKALLCMWK